MKTEKKLLRICSYNILYGGKDRIDDIVKVIKKIKPDICGILEAEDWQNNKKNFKKLAKNLGYSFFDIAKANSKHSMAIFSKLPLNIKSIKMGFRHVVIHAILRDGPFKGLSISFVHFSPVSEKMRLSETANLLNYLSKFSEKIIIGDFNSLSPYDPYDKNLLLKIFKDKKIKKFGTKNLRFDVVKKIEASGFVDSMNYLKRPFIPSTPTSSNLDTQHAAKLRIDYAFLSKNLLSYLKNSKIFINKDANKASDHYPIFIELQK
jgi:endonuclease/exonuclease/phosphatase family metal-dependent hydrolase